MRWLLLLSVIGSGCAGADTELPVVSLPGCDELEAGSAILLHHEVVVLGGTGSADEPTRVTWTSGAPELISFVPLTVVQADGQLDSIDVGQIEALVNPIDNVEADHHPQFADIELSNDRADVWIHYTPARWCEEDRLPDAVPIWVGTPLRTRQWWLDIR